MVKKYRVLFHGLRGDQEVFKVRLGHLGVPPETVDLMIRKAPVVLKDGLTLAAARRYADVVQEAGGKVTIQESGHFEESKRVNPLISIASLEDFVMCPECGLKQPESSACMKCGFRLTKEKPQQDRTDE